MQYGGCFHTAFAGSIPQRVQVANVNPLENIFIVRPTFPDHLTPRVTSGAKNLPVRPPQFSPSGWLALLLSLQFVSIV